MLGFVHKKDLRANKSKTKNIEKKVQTLQAKEALPNVIHATPRRRCIAKSPRTNPKRIW